jgi:trimethylamine corrinoid protein
MDMKDKIIQKARTAVLEYDPEMAEEAAREALSAGMAPVTLIQDGFTKAMNEVGDAYAGGKVYLPHVIAASEAMTAGVAVLTPAMEKLSIADDKGKGVVVIGTIEGDIHCIGKDIVAIMLKIAGYKVVNLGRDVPVASFVQAAREHSADYVGSSALMTSTMVNQIRIEELLKEEGIRDRVRTMVGGAPVTNEWASRIGADIYAENAQDAVGKLSEGASR